MEKESAHLEVKPGLEGLLIEMSWMECWSLLLFLTRNHSERYDLRL